MDTQKEIGQMLELYVSRYPQEAERLEPFMRFAGQFDRDALYDRKNFTGHITAGGFVASLPTGDILLLKHKQLGKWLQPGGHVEAGDRSVLDAAYREIAEETGIGCSGLELLPIAGEGERCPADVDSHYIPSCEAKNEKGHYHHDMRFAFLYDGADDPVRLDRLESEGFRWVTLDELEAMPDFRRVAPKIRKALYKMGVLPGKQAQDEQ